MKKPVQKRTKPTFKDAQKYLRAFFKNASNTDVRALWDVLSALRGPDEPTNDEKFKDATTAVIREAFLGKKVKTFPADFAIDSEQRARTRIEMMYSHFRSHARSAFGALDLKWDEYNPPKKGSR
jgi:hypothetical protein